ncbi:MAG: hypothetical protein HOO06_12560 [Bdellovibrionaceae bacterium]|jgi:predicted phosphodiesterase|nr:hypothetical protein [Pseudobdellovibrionaceae bacterium]
MKILKCLLLASLCASLFACTYPKLGEVHSRFEESTNGSLTIQGNIDPSGTNSFSFSVMGDIHMGSPFGHILDEAVTDSVAAGDSFAFLIGDITDNGRAKDFDTVISSLNDRGLAYRTALGNHDIYFGGWENYKKKFGAATYSFDVDNVHFSVLDSANGIIGQEQFNWLKSDLESTSQTVKIIISHYAPYTGQFQSPWSLSSNEESAILKNIAYENKVNMVISGHYHGLAEKTIGGVKYITTGSTNKIPNIGDERHYLQVTINNTTITTKTIEL